MREGLNARLSHVLCPKARLEEYLDWADGYISDTCIVRDGNQAPKVLGVHLGDENVSTNYFQRITEKVGCVREAVRLLEHVPSEITLNRLCLRRVALQWGSYWRGRFGRGKHAEGSGADGDGALLFFGGGA